MIDKLTKGQEAQLKVYRDKWLKIGLDTSRCDRKKAEKWIKEAYKVENLSPPSLFFWVESPLGCFFSSDSMGESIGRSIRESIGKNIGLMGESVGKSIRESIGKNIGETTWKSARESLWEKVRENIWKHLWENIWENFAEAVWTGIWDNWDNVRNKTARESIWESGTFRSKGNVCYGFNDAPWLGFYDFFLGVYKLNCCKKLIPLMELSKNCGWFLPYKNICVCSEKPETIKLINSKLHCNGGPAIHYRDGLNVWALNGIKVTKEIAETPSEQLDPKILIKEKNVEVRKEIIKKIGLARILQKLEAKKLDSFKKIYELYQINDIDIEPVHLLKMRCPSTDAYYCLRIPPNITKAKRAINWVNWDKENFLVET
jgi:hypothetical protein